MCTPDIPGTTLFDGRQARKGYALNKMCYSFNEAANREAFVRDEDAYCARYGLNEPQREAIRARNVLQLIEAGGNAYYLAKFAGIFGLDMQDIGAQQTGLTKAQFQARLAAPIDRTETPAMARILGGITTSHVPAIGRAIARNLSRSPTGAPSSMPSRRCTAGWPRPGPKCSWCSTTTTASTSSSTRCRLSRSVPRRSTAMRRRRGLPVMPPFEGEQALSWQLIDALVQDEFDITTCQEMRVDHAFTLPMALLWPDQAWPVKVVPVCINTVQFPLPSARRCYALGEAVGRAIRRWDSDARVAVLGTGGLSHQLDGERAGFINKDFDLQFMDSLVQDPTWATQFGTHELVEKAGTQGVELLMWLATRGALGPAVRCLHRNYHLPISNTASGLMLFETLR